MREIVACTDLLVVGLRKSGTTWLYENSKLQTGVVVDERVKESGFYNTAIMSDADVLHYNEHYTGVGIKAEFDASLCYSDQFVENINKWTSPNTRVVLLLRNPAEYLVSRCQHSVRKGELKSMDFNTAIETDWLSEELDYEKVINRFNSIHRANKEIIPFELIKKCPEAFYKSVFGELSSSIPEKDFYPQVKEAVNKSRRSKFRAVSACLSTGAKLARKMNAHALVNSLKKIGFHKYLEKENSQVDLSEQMQEAYKVINSNCPKSYELWKKIADDYM